MKIIYLSLLLFISNQIVAQNQTGKFAGKYSYIREENGTHFEYGFQLKFENNTYAASTYNAQADGVNITNQLVKQLVVNENAQTVNFLITETEHYDGKFAPATCPNLFNINMKWDKNNALLKNQNCND